MKTRVISLLALAFLLTATAALAQHPPVQARFNPEEDWNWSAGSCHTVQVQIRTATGVNWNMGSVQIDVYYDARDLSCTGGDTHYIAAPRLPDDYSAFPYDPMFWPDPDQGWISIFRGDLVPPVVSFPVTGTWQNIADIVLCVQPAPLHDPRILTGIFIGAGGSDYNPTDATFLGQGTYHAGSAGPVCGNGIVEPPEQCENSGQCGASYTCTNCMCVYVPACGNGIVDPGEECETTAQCGASEVCTGCQCVYVASCGNGIVDPGEDCETTAQCGASEVCTGCQCVYVASCGNGFVDPGEQCREPGLNCAPSYSCVTATCQCVYVASCGNGIVDPGEECETTAQCGASEVCTGCQCVYVPSCGNGIVDPGEQCREPGLNCAPSYNCVTATCQCVYAPQCGNGIVDPGEECENTAQCGPSEVCQACQCVYIANCGNGIVDPGEECETTAQCGPTETCLSCQCEPNAPICGNGYVEAGEACDAGPGNSNCGPVCRTNCTLYVPAFNNGCLDPTEECELGVLGCPVGEQCVAPGNCAPFALCGDGVVVAPEECEAGVGGCMPGESCVDCQCVYVCVREDGIRNPGEACDLDSDCGDPNFNYCDALCQCKTSVSLLFFKAMPNGTRVTLEWRTATEPDNVGFYLWKSDAENGTYARLNGTLIPAEGDATRGADYGYVDTNISQGVTRFYKLEAIDVNGGSSFFGPVDVTMTKPLAGCGVVSETGAPLAAFAFWMVVVGAVIVAAKSRKKGYAKPEVKTTSSDEMVQKVGPAQTCSPSPTCPTGN